MSSKTYLIRVTGDDRPGVTAALTGALADHGVRVLDISQAVIHEMLLLGMMIRVPAAAGPEAVLDAVRRRAEPLGLRLRAAEVADDAYDAWVARQGASRYIVTLLARSITAERLAAVAGVIRDQGLNIDVITRLSGRPPLEPDRDRVAPPRACIEFSVRGEPTDADAMHAELLRLSQRLDCDIAWQLDSVYRRTRRLVALDMDSTLIQAEVIDELAREAGAGERCAAITEAAMRGELDFDESLRRRVALLAGLDEAVLATVADRLELTEGAETLIRNLHRFGYKTAIISGGFTYFGRFLQEKLGIDYVCANELEIEGGRLTGRVVPPIINGQRKAQWLREIARREHIALEQVIAVGDGANDLPMLNTAGLGIAFHAKPIVQATAEHKISNLGLDGILYLIGVRDRDLLHPGRSPGHPAPAGGEPRPRSGGAVV